MDELDEFLVLYSPAHVEILGIYGCIYLMDMYQIYFRNFKENTFLDHPKHGNYWFVYTQKECQKRTGLTREQQTSASKKLVALEWVQQMKIGLPGKRHFRIRTDIAENFRAEYRRFLEYCYKIDVKMRRDHEEACGKEK